MELIYPRRRNPRGVRNLVRVILQPLPAVGAQQRAAWDVTDPGAERHLQGELAGGPPQRLDVGQPDLDQVLRLQVPQRQCEEILPLRLHERRSMALGFLSCHELPGRFPLLDPRPDHTVVDQHFAHMHRRIGGQGELVQAIQRRPVVLEENLGDRDLRQPPFDCETAPHRLERQHNAPGFLSGNQPELHT